MKRTIVSALLFLFAFGAGKAVHAHGTEWETLNEEIGSLYKQGHYDRAVVVPKKALALAEEGVGRENPDVAQSLENMAAFFRETGREKEAEALQKRAATILAMTR